MFAVTIGGGQLMATPDVCQMPTPTGPVPVPYPNIAMPTMGTPPAETVLVSGAPALNLQSEIPMTNGDQAGPLGGVTSGTIMGPAKFTQGSQKVMIGGSPAVRLTTPTSQNQNNAMGAVLVPSQAVVMIMS
ncbi:DUF4150 domain-containing protein [Chitinasiproducens palmae]|uniref:Uncharacterized protein n=1 Tax=Chitinasiproducens palmae TaxID=1770053 RepID=A0A1H2PMZ5_9BURK|nr:DUF4150 domain-containing protein [Chitinasiproducens palmae]SDV47150.1 protein of unknown function [Chitinasiproducens palmae]